MKEWWLISITAFAIFAGSAFFACSSAEDPPLIFAAASLIDVMEDLAQQYEQETGETVRFSFGGSNLIANQIIAGASANAVIVAGQTPIGKLVDAGNARYGDAVEILTNRLVAVRSSGSDSDHASPNELVGVGKIAMPDASTAPAGEYFEAALKELGLWDALQSQVVPTLDVRAALAAASSGNVAYAFVYVTDAMTTDDVEIAFAIEGKSDATIPRYYASPMLDDDKAEGFIGYLTSPQAKATFERYGFKP